MKDQVTSKERVLFPDDCAGCGKNVEQVLIDYETNIEEVEEYSVWTNCGWWYCHTDCYRDSK